jgi:hypothetical protein
MNSISSTRVGCRSSPRSARIRRVDQRSATGQRGRDSRECLVFIFVVFFELQQKPMGHAVLIIINAHDVAAGIDPELAVT